MNQPKIVSILLAFLFLSSQSYSQTVDQWAVDGIVQFRVDQNPGFDITNYSGGNVALDLLITSSGVDSITQPYPWVGNYMDSIYRVSFSNYATVDALISGLEALPFVDFAEKYPLCSEYHTPNDLQPQQWGLTKIDAEVGWDFSLGSNQVKIAVVDNSFAIDHEDLVGNLYTNQVEAGGLPFVDDDLNGFVDDINGYDVSNSDNNPRPPSGATNSSNWVHGTHVAGIASASTNNGIGMAGLGYNCAIIPVKCANNSGDGATFDRSIDGIFYAIQVGADIINMSFGTPVNSQVMQNMINQAAAQDIVLVGAAGNDGVSSPFYPAAYPQVISVGATGVIDDVPFFSNFGSTIDVMAPGVDIYSALIDGNNTYGNLTGTSMAAPLVAGLAGLIKTQNGSLNSGQIKARIVSGCENIDAINPTYVGQIGAGRINAANSLGNVYISNISKEVFQFWPNPAGQEDLVQFGNTTSGQTYQLFELTGRLIGTGLTTNGLRVQDLQPGVYLVKIHSKTEKLVVQ